MPFIDTHIHLQDFQTNSIKELVASLQRHDITKCICISAQEQDWDKVALLHKQFPNFIIPAFAVHPWYAKYVADGWEKRLEQHLQQFPQALVGECGLDKLKNPERDKQDHVFQAQISLANKYKRTLLIHAVKAQEWLADYWSTFPSKFVFHSFNGRPDFLQTIIGHGGYVAFNKRILQNKTKEEILKLTPQNRMLFESDAPYQSQSEDIYLLCQKVATIRQEKLEDLQTAVYANALEIING